MPGHAVFNFHVHRCTRPPIIRVLAIATRNLTCPVDALHVLIISLGMPRTRCSCFFDKIIYQPDTLFNIEESILNEFLKINRIRIDVGI